MLYKFVMVKILNTIKKGGDVPPSMRLICSFTQNRMVQYMNHNSPNSTELYMYNHYCMNK